MDRNSPPLAAQERNGVSSGSPFSESPDFLKKEPVERRKTTVYRRSEGRWYHVGRRRAGDGRARSDVKQDIYQLTRPELGERLAAWGAGSDSLRVLWRSLYRDLGDWNSPGLDLPLALRRQLDETFSPPTPPKVARHQRSSDQLTRKFLLELNDGVRIETVLMHFRDRATACLSTQAGCALDCVFCATGQAGFTRQLSTAEIVAQALFVERQLRESLPSRDRQSRAELRNLVLMGMGEPLLNYDAVMRALAILGESSGMAIGAKQATISTVGVIPGIVRLADEARPYSLAVSLHAATQSERLAMIPTAKAWPLDELLDACRYYTTIIGRKIFFEWTLVEGANDSIEQARQLADLLRDIPAQVNLIPLNPTDGYAGEATQLEAARRFQTTLRELGIPATVRQRRGIDIAAGCGQLAASDPVSISPPSVGTN